jgi:TonB-linked SusC/RagA family outer membrane protein
MRNSAITLLASLILISWRPVMQKGNAQMLAFGDAHMRTVQNEHAPTMQLKEALLALKAHYQVDIIFADHLVYGRTVPTALIQTKSLLEKDLAELLKLHGLGFKKGKSGSYIILANPVRDRRKADYTNHPDVIRTHYEGVHSSPGVPTSSEVTPANSVYKILDHTISGQVTDGENNEPLPGVNIVLKDTQLGTSTDANGNFSLSIPDEYKTNGILIFSFVGYQSIEAAVNSLTQLNVQMKADLKSLEEVIVVGYGTQKRGDVTGAVSSISAKDIQGLPTPSIDAALAGKMPGVQVSQTTGTPGGGLTVRVRGTGSIGAGNEPLYVVDGFPVTANYDQRSNPLASINPNDIESIEVLKDASSTAIYGSRGSNGVVLITTKGGKSGKMKVDLETYTGFQKITKKMDLMNASEFGQYIKDSRNNAWIDTGGDPSAPNSQRAAIYQILPALQNPETLGEGTDWQDEVFRTAPIHNLQATLSGGTDKVRYLVSGGYFKQDGIILNSDFKRYSFRVNLEANASKKFKLGLNLTPSYTVSNPTDSEGHFSSGALVLSTLMMAPHLPVKDENGNYTSALALGNGFSSLENPVKTALLRKRTANDLRLLGTVYGEYEILKDLKYKLLVGTDLQNRNERFFNPSTVGSDGNPAPVIPRGNFNSNYSYNLLLENTLNYARTVGDHNLNVLAGYTAQKAFSHGSAISATNFPNDLVETLNAGIVSSAGTNVSEWALLSYLARLNYSYKGKYLLTGTIRQDGSSRFGENNKWGTFPSVSAGWRISEEGFLKTVPQISELKLRASFGFTGNNFIGNYDHVGLLAIRNTVFGTGSGSIVNGIAPSSVGNPSLSWERNRQLDFGMELGLLQNRLFFIADFYEKITSDLLLSVPTPSLTGYTSARQNIGKVRNKGFEFAVSSRNLVNKLQWTTDFNIAFNRNTVLALGPSGEPIFGNYQLTNSHITQVGQSLGNYYGYEVEGIFQTTAEINDSPAFADSKPGHFKFKDQNGDGRLTVEDRTSLGSPHPDLIFGITNTLSYKGFDVNVLIQGVQGNEILHLGRRFYANYAGTANGLKEMTRAWKSQQEPGDGRTPRVNRDLNAYSSSNSSANISSTHVEDGSFVRVRNIAIGYNLSKGLAEKLALRSIRVYANLQNPITWTKYSGFNPEVSVTGADPLTPGVDYGGYPIAKVFTLGLNVGF